MIDLTSMFCTTCARAGQAKEVALSLSLGKGGCLLSRTFSLLEASCIWTELPLTGSAERGCSSPGSLCHLQSITKLVSCLGSISWNGFAQKRGKQLARKPVCAQSDTVCSHAICWFGDNVI